MIYLKANAALGEEKEINYKRIKYESLKMYRAKNRSEVINNLLTEAVFLVFCLFIF